MYLFEDASRPAPRPETTEHQHEGRENPQKVIAVSLFKIFVKLIILLRKKWKPRLGESRIAVKNYYSPPLSEVINLPVDTFVGLPPIVNPNGASAGKPGQDHMKVGSPGEEPFSWRRFWALSNS